MAFSRASVMTAPGSASLAQALANDNFTFFIDTLGFDSESVKESAHSTQWVIYTESYSCEKYGPSVTANTVPHITLTCKALELTSAEEDLEWLALPCSTTNLVSVQTQRICNPFKVTSHHHITWRIQKQASKGLCFWEIDLKLLVYNA